MNEVIARLAELLSRPAIPRVRYPWRGSAPLRRAAAAGRRPVAFPPCERAEFERWERFENRLRRRRRRDAWLAVYGPGAGRRAAGGAEAG